MNQAQVAAAVVVMRDNKILMLQRQGSEGSGTWAIPGGKVDFMEDPLDAVAHELREETSLVAKNIKFIGYTSDIHTETNKHFVTLRFLCAAFSGSPKVAEPEKCSAIDWFDLDNLPSHMFGPTSKLLTSPKVLEKLRKAMQ